MQWIIDHNAIELKWGVLGMTHVTLAVPEGCQVKQLDIKVGRRVIPNKFEQTGTSLKCALATAVVLEAGQALEIDVEW